MSRKRFALAVLVGILFATLQQLGDFLFVNHLKSHVLNSIVDDALSGLWGFLTFVLYSKYLQDHHEAARLRQLAVITAEMNHHIRNSMAALVAMCETGKQPDPEKLTQVISRINFALEELLPTAHESPEPRYFVAPTIPPPEKPESAHTCAESFALHESRLETHLSYCTSANRCSR
jgi:hypothetical protein